MSTRSIPYLNAPTARIVPPENNLSDITGHCNPTSVCILLAQAGCIDVIWPLALMERTWESIAPQRQAMLRRLSQHTTRCLPRRRHYQTGGAR